MAKKIWLKKLLLGIAGGKGLKKLNKASLDCRKTQEEVLKSILQYAKDSEYGKKHGFEDIATIEDYQRKIPITDYEDFRPYVDRMKKGEENILFPGMPLMYGTTSGTTKEPKFIPISDRYYDESYKEYGRVWLYTCVKENPSIFDGQAFSVVGKAVEGTTECGTPYGSLGGHAYKNIPGFMKDIYSAPYATFMIDNYDFKYYTLVRCAIEQNITYAVTPNPSTFVQVNLQMRLHGEEMISDIENGTLSARLNIEPELRKEIEENLKPNPKRAAELREILSRDGTLMPRNVWPNLALVNLWKCGNSGLYLKQLEGTWPDKTIIREFAFQATECRGGTVLNNDDMDSVMTCHVNYFEFVKEEEMELDNPRIYGAWELEKGQRYNIIITSSNGLYRYNMNDILECNGFYNTFPKMRFIQKGSGVVSLTGEKLSESQFLDAVTKAEEETGLKTNFSIGFGEFESSRYHVYVEFKKEISEDEEKRFAEMVDTYLKEYNEEYASKRDTKRLKEPVLHKLKENSFDNYKTECVNNGARDGQFKMVHLKIDEKSQKIFDRLTY